MGTFAIKKIFVIFLLLLAVGCTGAFQLDKAEDMTEQSSLETKADGTGLKINDSVLLDQDEVLEVYAIYRNKNGEFVKAIEVSWRLVGGTGNLNILSNGISAQFSSSTSGDAKIQVVYEDIVISETSVEVKDLVLPELSWTVSSVTASEGSSAVLTVDLEKVYDQVVSFDVSTTDATAVAGSDYTGKSAETVTIPIGDTQATITIPLSSDNYYEHTSETFNVTLSNFKKTFMNTTDTATVTITNQDAVPEVSVADLSVNEDVGNAQLTISLSRPSTQAVDINYATSDSTAEATGSYIDYTATSGSVTIAAGNTSVSVNVPINDDNLDEINEQFDFTISSPVNATLGTQTTSTVTVNDNDLPSNVIIGNTTVMEGDTASLTVSFSPATGQATGFDWATQDNGATAPADYTAQATTSVVVPKHTTSMTLTVSTVENSTMCQVNREILVNLTNLDKLVSDGATGTITLNENDVPTIILTDSIATEGDGNATYTAQLDDTSCALDVSFEYKTFPLDALEEHDYTYTTGTATIKLAETANISVPVIDDTLNEGTQKFLLVAMNNENLVNGKVDQRSMAITTLNDNDGAEIPSVIDVTQKSGTCAVMGDGDVKCWGAKQGNYRFGEFNVGDESSDMGTNLDPINLGSVNSDGIAPFFTIKESSINRSAGCAILSNDGLKCWGYNYRGKLGIGEGESPYGDQLDEMGDNSKFVQLDTNNIPEKVYMGTYVACGIFHASASPATKFAKCWGNEHYTAQGDYGDSSIGDSTTDVNNLTAINFGTGLTPKTIDVGRDHACAILSDDSLKCWGDNDTGELGINSSADQGNTDTSTGDNLPTAILGSTVKQVSAGSDYTCAILSNNRIKCWGYDEYGRAGSEVSMGYNVSSSTAYRVGDDPSEMDSLNYIDLGTKDDNSDGTPDGVNPLEFTVVQTGESHTCAITADGLVKCWGRNSYGQLGHGNTNSSYDSSDFGDGLPYSELGTGLTATDLYVGSKHTCALLSDNSVKCWGFNYNGQLGLGHTNHIGDEPGEMGDNLTALNLNGSAIKLADNGDGRSDTTCAIMSTNEMKCWGDNNEYNILQRNDLGIGDESGEMGVNTPTFNIGSSLNIRSIDQRCALDSNGDVYCWGDTSDAFLGDGVSYLNYDFGDNFSQVGNYPKVLLPSGKKALQISVTHYTTCALLDDFTVRCWGYNNYGQAGIGLPDRAVGDSLSELGDNMQAVDFGTGKYPIALTAQNGFCNSSCSYGTSYCALLNTQEVKCWGSNDYGVLGIESSIAELGQDSAELGDNWPSVKFGSTGFTTGGPKVKKVVGGVRMFCALFENQKIKCWGGPTHGQLGYEDSITRGIATDSMEDDLPFVNLGTGVLVKDIYRSHKTNICVKTTTNSIKCWGFDGNGDLLSNGTSWSRGGSVGDMGDNLPDSYLGPDPVMQMFTGEVTCPLYTNGRIRCFGYNDYGRLGQETTATLDGTQNNIDNNLPYIKLESGH